MIRKERREETPESVAKQHSGHHQAGHQTTGEERRCQENLRFDLRRELSVIHPENRPQFIEGFRECATVLFRAKIVDCRTSVLIPMRQKITIFIYLYT